MIPRYSISPMKDLFTDEARFGTWLEVEILAVEAWAELGVVPAADAATIRRRGGFDVAEIEARERVTNHDVAAFVDVVAQRVGEPAGKWVHYGLTSSDVVDTALSLTLTRASELLVDAASRLEAVIAKRARELRDVPVVGRTHGSHAEFAYACASAGAAVEAFATEIRHLQRTEVGEAAEPFATGAQKGSSAMPHKRNPVRCEQLSGLARVLRSNVVAALENVALWHERDISHSSVERVILPDSAMLAYYLMVRFADIVEGLEVFPERMLENLERSYGLVFSQPVLLALVASGLSRDAAYRLTQRAAMTAWEQRRPFHEILAADPEVTDRLSSERLAACFDL